MTPGELDEAQHRLAEVMGWQAADHDGHDHYSGGNDGSHRYHGVEPGTANR